MRGVAAAAALGAMLLPTATADPSAVSPAVIRDGQRLTCGEVRRHELDALGGCKLRPVRGEVGITVLTIFGDEPLGNCPFRFQARVGQGGRLVLDRIRVDAYAVPDARLRQACGDIAACRPVRESATEDLQGLPWSGRIVRDEAGDLMAEIDVCLDTCFGRFEGRSRLSLRQRPDRTWLLWTPRSPVGTSGMELAGTWDLEPSNGDTLTLDAR